MNYKKTALINEEKVEIRNELLSMTGKECYDKFGLKRDETITETITFDNGHTVDIKIVICEGDEKPYIDIVLFNVGGGEVSCAVSDNEKYVGEYEITDEEDNIYTVVIEPSVQLNITATCTCIYNSCIQVPKGLTIDEAIEYADNHIKEIPLGELSYVRDSDELDKENCDFEETD